MLDDFVTTHTAELITRCRVKAAGRYVPPQIPMADDNGVPLFLKQLSQTLREERTGPAAIKLDPAQPLSHNAIGRTAFTHGSEMLRLGFTIDQVVREYGDVCQSITQLAIEKRIPISVDEFRTLNRCLDDAIADAVTAHSTNAALTRSGQADILHDNLDDYFAEQNRLLDIANNALAAIRTMRVGLGGATGNLLTHALAEMSALSARTVPVVQKLK